MLETERRRIEKRRRDLAVCCQDPARSGAPDCPVCTGQCPVCQAGATRTGRSREIGRRRTAKIHRTVRCAPDCPVSQRSARANGRPRILRVTRGLANGRKEAPDCPVRPTTEGKDGLPDLFSTAPSCLGAIKGTPRRMEENTKHSYNLSKHQDIDLAHSIQCDSI